MVWRSEIGAIIAFELCYGKPRVERALRWDRQQGYGHFRVDSGEDTPTKNRTPILVSDGSFPKAQLVAQFSEASASIEPTIRTFVLTKLQELPS